MAVWTLSAAHLGTQHSNTHTKAMTATSDSECRVDSETLDSEI